jgi:hypothetical protein
MTTIEKKPISATTKKQYENRISLLGQAGVDYIADPPSLFKWFAETNQGESSQKLYLSAIKNQSSAPFPTIFQDKIKELIKKQNEKATDQKLSAKQEEKYIAYDKLVATQKALKGVKGFERDYLIASLYILQMPVRADYGDMKVFKSYNKKRTGNEFIFKKNPEFVFREYKTAKTYGEVRIPVSLEMLNVIKGYFAHLGRTPMYLVGSVKSGSGEILDEPLTPSGFAGAVERVFGVGVSLIRHAFITEIFPSLKSLPAKNFVAERMLHSRTLQEQYNLPDKN